MIFLHIRDGQPLYGINYSHHFCLVSAHGERVTCGTAEFVLPDLRDTVKLETNFEAESRRNSKLVGFTLVSIMKKIMSHLERSRRRPRSGQKEGGGGPGPGTGKAAVAPAPVRAVWSDLGGEAGPSSPGGNKQTITEDDGSQINPKPNKLKAIFSPFSHKKKPSLDPTDNDMDIVQINGKTWDSIKVLSEKDIKELIEQKQYFKADCHLIKLEHVLYAYNTNKHDEDILKEKKKGVESLYEMLSAEIFTVVKNSMNISKENPNLLKMAVQVKIQEEQADQIYIEEKGKFGGITEVRPRGWATKWLNFLEQSVNERLGKLPSVSDVDKAKCLYECLVQHQKKMEEDFDTIVNYIKPCYPQEYNICEKYAEYYHKKCSSHLELIMENGPKGKDVYCFLHWIYIHYPKLMNIITQSEDESQKLLNLLLPEKTISRLKSEYFSALQSDASMHMDKSLQVEEVIWRSEGEPIVLNGYYHSELSIDIIQIIEGSIKDTRTLTCDMAIRAQDIMLEETTSFLERFQQSAENFERSNFNQTNYISIIILITNCCEVIRNYIDTNEKITSAELKERVLSILNEMEKKRKDILFNTLFCKLKPHCKKLVTLKWLESSNPINNLLEILEEHLTKFKKLKEPLYQDLLRKIHAQLITEYIIRITKKRLKCKTNNQQKKVADQMEDEAIMLQKFFTFYGSEDSSLEFALLKIAEIIRLKDIKAITVEVAALFQDFPDVGKEHIEAILYIKGNMKKSDEKKILKILSSLMNNADTSMDMKLFSSPTTLKAL
ncbi:tumor necrosis factor alpha-induced protein 2-like [Narcine bancroftii]|uniref:tumor necrosis factor alpha-induced protein 2-like n=1 Tax=Narcine bancroftii TaxID=1343680 RepID=UPI0038310F68